MPHLVTGQTVDLAKRELAYRLRREMTSAEQFLWSHLRGNRLSGLHFRRQQIVHGFVADFYCHAAGVIVEVDGGIHDTQLEYDAARDRAFASIGLLVLRVQNEDVIGRVTTVLARICAACVERIAVEPLVG